MFVALIDSFQSVSFMRQTVSLCVISVRLHLKGQHLYGCLTLRTVIWKTIKRKINSQLEIRQIVNLNDTCNKNKLILNFWDKKSWFLSIKGGLFSEWAGTLLCWSYIITHTVSIISFHTVCMRAVKSLVSFLFIQDLHGSLCLHYIHLTFKQVLSGLNMW